MTQKKAALLLLIIFLILISAFDIMTVNTVSSAKAKRFIHRDTIVHGDGARLYAYMRSAWFDRDLDTANELDHYFNYPGSREPRPIIRTSTGYAWNHTPVGCALLWSPFFLFGHVTALRLGETPTGIEADGYSPPYTLAVATGTHVYCFLGMLLLLAICCRFFSPTASLFAVLTIWFASFLPAYLFLYPSMSHALSFFCICLFLWLWLKTRGRSELWRWCLLGLAAGLMALVRTQNIIFMIVPLAWLFTSRDRTISGLRLNGQILLMLACSLIAFLPQLYTWKVTYGSWITIPQGGGFLHWGHPAILKILFSSRHGLFSWTPALLLGVIGLPYFIKRERLLGLSLLAAFLLQLYINSIVDDWWAGTGFGARRFANCLPVFALGLAGIFEGLRSKGLTWLAAAISAALILWNGLFLCQYALNWVSHMEAIDMGRMVRNQGRVAIHIVQNGSRLFK